MKKTIRLTESDLSNIIREAINEVSEGKKDYLNTLYNPMLKLGAPPRRDIMSRTIDNTMKQMGGFEDDFRKRHELIKYFNMFSNGDINIEELAKKAEELKLSDEFKSTQDELLGDYEKAYNKHKEQNPNLDECIRRAIRKVLR